MIEITDIIKTRFDGLISKTESCWVWNGPIWPTGYGRFVRGNGGQSLFAHRVSYTIHKGQIPDGLLVCHKCDNPPCVNPEHLFLGTISDNNKDRSSKGRYRGEWNGRAKLNTAAVIQILKTHSDTGVNKAEISKHFGVAVSTVRDLIRGKSWKHIPRPQKAVTA